MNSKACRPLLAWRHWGVDRAIAYTVFGRGWAALSGPITLLLLARFLSREEQGFYYTFGSILGLQIFFELGLGWVLVQFAAHEKAHLHWSEAGTLEGDAAAKGRLASLLRLSFTWYVAAAVLALLVLLPGGLVFFASHQGGAGVKVAANVWRIPWVCVVLFSTTGLLISPLLAILEGCGLISEIALMSLFQSVVGTFCLWIAFRLGWGLYAGPLSAGAGLAMMLVWMWTRRRHFLFDLLHNLPRPVTVNWRREVWPLQWKFAVSWLCNYFIFQLFNPVLFAFSGTVEAGRMGMSLSVMGAISATAIAWVTTKAVPFGGLVAKREFKQLDALFFPALWRSFALAIVGGVALWVGVFYLHTIEHPLSRRLLDLLPLGLLIAAASVQHLVGALAIYLRAHKQEPFLWLSVVAACLTGASTYALGRAFGSTGMMAGYLAVNAGVGLCGGTWIFTRKRREWHTEAPTVEEAPIEGTTPPFTPERDMVLSRQGRRTTQ